MTHKFKVGDQVVFVNDFGVCWGVKTITKLDWRGIDRKEYGPKKPAYQYGGIDTPWCPVSEKNLTLATSADREAHRRHDLQFLVDKYGFKPTIEELGGCY